MEEIRCIKCGRACKECGLDTLGAVEGIGIIPLRELEKYRYELWFECSKCSGWEEEKKAKPKNDQTNNIRR